MKTFTNLEEMQPYYNVDCNAYIFVENQKMIDVEFNFNLNIDSNITAGYIQACDINAKNIKAEYIKAEYIKAWDIEARDIKTGNIDAWNIDAEYINAWDIKARDIHAKNINANNINANNIEACDIKFYAVCFSYKTFVCDSIKGNHKNSRYFCLDSDVVINKKED